MEEEAAWCPSSARKLHWHIGLPRSEWLRRPGEGRRFFLASVTKGVERSEEVSYPRILREKRSMTAER